MEHALISKKILHHISMARIFFGNQLVVEDLSPFFEVLRQRPEIMR